MGLARIQSNRKPRLVSTIADRASHPPRFAREDDVGPDVGRILDDLFMDSFTESAKTGDAGIRKTLIQNQVQLEVNIPAGCRASHHRIPHPPDCSPQIGQDGGVDQGAVEARGRGNSVLRAFEESDGGFTGGHG